MNTDAPRPVRAPRRPDPGVKLPDERQKPFVPPGYMASDELVELTGKSQFKDAWTDAMQASAAAAATAARLATQVHLDRAKIAARGSHSRPSSEVAERHREDAAKAAATARQVARPANAMRRQVITALRTVLCVGDIPAVIKTARGELVEIPPHVWQGDGAIPALETGAVAGGQVLFARAEAEAWLARGDELSTPATPATAKEKARGWFRAEVARGNKCRTRDDYCAGMVQQFDISDRCAGRIWDAEAPETWKRKGWRLGKKTPH